MSAPNQDRLFAVLDATWPAARRIPLGPWVLREGKGGGNRVSAATQRGPFATEDIDAAEAAMRGLGQRPLFMVRPGDAALDDALAARGYLYRDLVATLICPASQLADQPMPPLTAFPLWEPLAIMREIWAHDGIGPARIEVMNRVTGPKTALFGRIDDQPAGTAFVGIHDGVAMLHALSVTPALRRRGLAQWMMRAAAVWALDNGADWLAVQVARENTGACRLYEGLQMQEATIYHYRKHPQDTPTAAS